VCVRHATGALAKAACGELLSDEIDHARLGWGFLETVRRPLLRETAPWLLPIVRANVRIWRETRRPHEDTTLLAGHGAPSHEALDAAIVGAVKDLIVPGLARLGLPTGPITDWLAG
jgi:hypothetical protein